MPGYETHKAVGMATGMVYAALSGEGSEFVESDC